MNELLPIINIIGSKPLEIPEVILTKDIVIRISNEYLPKGYTYNNNFIDKLYRDMNYFTLNELK